MPAFMFTSPCANRVRFLMRQEVLLIHELEQVIEAGNPEQFAVLLPSLLPVLMRCISSENCKVAQRALQMFSSDRFVVAWCGCGRGFRVGKRQPAK